MKLFKCQACGNILYFENRTCGQCGHRRRLYAGNVMSHQEAVIGRDQAALNARDIIPDQPKFGLDPVLRRPAHRTPPL